MIIRYYILLALTLCSIHAAVAQNEDTNNDANVSPTNVAKAKFQINDIKSRGIIVRLKTNTDRIEAYRKAGYKSAADLMEIKARASNMLLMHAFITEWAYCPVYFMESQYSTWLLTHDTMVVKTYDLRRDTSIYMNHDSFYVLDIGDLMHNEIDENHPNRSSASHSSAAGVFFVVKDHNQEQLQSPMPHEAKLWLEEFPKTDGIRPIEVEKWMIDSIQKCMVQYPLVKDLIKSECKDIVTRYQTKVYEHIFEKITPNDNAAYTQVHSTQVNGYVARDGFPQQQTAQRLGKAFIDYFCKRYDKDRNIIYNSDPLYWWLRNPNMRYLPALHDLELQLKSLLDENPNLTK